jgi:hypothetical protein
MKLIIQRDQANKKNIFGMHKGVQFSLAYKVMLSPEEFALVKKYKVADEVLHTTKNGREVTIKELMNGTQLIAEDIKILFEMESMVRGVAQSFKNYLDVLESFGGEEIIEIESRLDDDPNFFT